MKKCPECGTFVPDDNRFCTSCGASLADAQTVMDEISGEAEQAAEEVKESVEETAVAAVEETTEAVASEENKEEESIAASFAPQPPTPSYAPVAPAPVIDNSGSSSSNTSSQSFNEAPASSGIPGSASGIVQRNIVLCIVFSLITCGIYELYWIYKLNEEINQLSGEEGTNGGLVILFGILTCGIYNWYWMYKMGEKCDIIKGDKDGSSHIIYLVLAICELSIVSLCLMQDNINKHAAA